ncbi:MAG: tetratricopeptide repeat protein [Myxococcota bacterium]
MGTGRFERARQIFSDALALPVEQRTAFVERASGGDTSLRDWVHRLLHADANAMSTQGLVERILPTADGLHLPIGATLGERLTVIAQIGAGGMASVWKVQDAVLGRMVALKILSQPFAVFAQRMRAEGQMQQRLNHPNIVSLIELLELDGRPALLTEFIEGPTLHDLLAERALREAQVDALAGGIFSGMDAVHAAGLVHRDLKTTNILLAPSTHGPVPKVADFGIARLIGSTPDQPALTQTGAALGTPAYMAPEQIRNAKHVDQTADVWSLGCILFEMATGEPVFTGADTGEIMMSVLLGETRLERMAGLPDRWQAAISAALQTNPADRPQGCQALKALWAAPPCTPDVWAGVRIRPPQSTAPPPPRHTTAPPVIVHNLPDVDASCFGHGDLMARIGEAMRPGALITVVGTAGVGKTRVALQLARQRMAAWRGGVAFCDLSDASAVKDICAVTADALGVPLSVAPPVQQLAYAIQGRGRCLLLLDNAEHILDPVRAVLAKWRAAEDACIIVTSRAALGLQGEQVFSLAPLSVPDPDGPRSEIGASPAVALFVDRARRVQPRFKLTADNAQDVARLVGRLDGLPLAIELAAARARVMGPQKMLSRMDQRFRLLTSRTAPIARHATLRAALEWSWTLLPPVEQAALAQLSVFEGGFTLEAAEAMLQLGDWRDPPWPEELLDALVEKSLLKSTPTNNSVRFDMLVSIQSFATEKLRDPDAILIEDGAPWSGPDRAEDAQRSHGAYFAALPEDAALQERENLIAACQRAIAREDATVAARCALLNWIGAERRGPVEEGVRLLQQVEQTLPLLPLLQAEIDWRFAILCRRLGKIDDAETRLVRARDVARAANAAGLEGKILVELGITLSKTPRRAEVKGIAERALKLARQSRNTPLEGRCLYLIARLTAEQEPKRALTIYDDALKHARDGDALTLQIDILNDVGKMTASLGAHQKARDRLREAIEISARIGDTRRQGICQSNMADILHFAGQPHLAQANVHASLMLARRSGDRAQQGQMLGHMGHLYIDLSKDAEAEICLEQALQIATELKDLRRACTWLNALSSVHKRRGELDRAREMLARSLEYSQQTQDRIQEGIVLGHIGMIDALEGDLDAADANFQDALAIARAVQHRRFQGAWTGELANIQLARGQFHDALNGFEDAIAITQKLGDRRQEGLWWARMTAPLCELGRLDEARDAVEEAIAIAAEVSDVRLEALARRMLGTLYIAQGDPNAANAPFKRAEAILRHITDPQMLATFLYHRAQLEHRLGHTMRFQQVVEEMETIVEGLRMAQTAPLRVKLATLQQLNAHSSEIKH